MVNSLIMADLERALRIVAVAKAGDRLESRDASSYVSALIVACAKLAPPDD